MIDLIIESVRGRLRQWRETADWAGQRYGFLVGVTPEKFLNHARMFPFVGLIPLNSDAKMLTGRCLDEVQAVGILVFDREFRLGGSLLEDDPTRLSLWKRAKQVRDAINLFKDDSTFASVLFGGFEGPEEVVEIDQEGEVVQDSEAHYIQVNFAFRRFEEVRS